MNKEKYKFTNTESYKKNFNFQNYYDIDFYDRQKIGANVKLVTCDQGLNNQNVFRLFKISATNPWFEVDGDLYCGLSSDQPIIRNATRSWIYFHRKRSNCLLQRFCRRLEV